MKIVLDPVPGAHGPGRLFVNEDGGRATEAYVSTTLCRNFERICVGRPVKDMARMASYACGVDSLPHSLATVRALEGDSSAGFMLPNAAYNLRNLMSGLDFVAQHLTHTYNAFLPSLVAPAVFTSAQKFTGSGNNGELHDNLLNEAVKRYNPPGNGGQMGSHFRDAFTLRRKIHRALAALGGRYPPQMTIVLGGVAGAPTTAGMSLVASVLSELDSFIQRNLLGGMTIGQWESFVSGNPSVVVNDLLQSYSDLPTSRVSTDEGWGDLLLSLALGCELCASEYLDLPMSARLERQGGYPSESPGGVGFLSSPMFPLPENDYQVQCGGFTPIYEISADAPREMSIDGFSEHITNSYFQIETGDVAIMTPGVDMVVPPENILGVPMDDPGPDTPYSWATAPRYQNQPCEVGPLARMVNLRQPLVMGLCQLLSFYGNSPANVLVREIARMQELITLLGLLKQWLDEGIPSNSQSYTSPQIQMNETLQALQEGPRGTFVHWIRIDSNANVSYYHTISANAFNLSPRDAGGIEGPAELATRYQHPEGSGVGFGNNLRSNAGKIDAEQEALEPWALISTLRSYAPCFSCAGH